MVRKLASERSQKRTRESVRLLGKRERGRNDSDEEEKTRKLEPALTIILLLLPSPSLLDQILLHLHRNRVLALLDAEQSLLVGRVDVGLTSWKIDLDFSSLTGNGSEIVSSSGGVRAFGSPAKRKETAREREDVRGEVSGEGERGEGRGSGTNVKSCRFEKA